MKRILDTTRPVGGMWTYKQPETGVVLQDWAWKALISKIREHRAACGIEMKGGWVDEIHDDVATANPEIPQEEVGVVARYYTADDVHRFITTMRRVHVSGELVSEEEQRRRIDICVACPKNGVIGCKWCGWLAGQVTEVLAGRPIHRVAEVFKRSCMACGCDITSKTAIPLDVLKQVDAELGESPNYAKGCWMTETTE
jgi:hypothetical protein